MRRLQFHLCGSFDKTYEEQYTLFRTDFGKLCLLAGLAVLYGVVPYLFGPHGLHLLNTIGIFAIAATGLNLLTGSVGRISLAHGAFFGIGAYTAALLKEFPLLLSLPCSGIAAALIGVGFLLPSIRLKGVYFAVATLATQVVLEYVFQWRGPAQEGAEAIMRAHGPLLAPLQSDPRLWFYIILTCCVVLTFAASNLVRSRFGLAFAAIRDNERAAREMGLHVWSHRLLACALSSFYAGVAGALHSSYSGAMIPDFYGWVLSAGFIAMIVLGGLGSIQGSILGAAVIVLVIEALSCGLSTCSAQNASGLLNNKMFPLAEIVFGTAIVLVVFLRSKGIVELWARLREGVRLWPFST